MKAFRFTLGEAMVTIGFLALLFSAVAMASGLWLPLGVVAMMILLPSYLVGSQPLSRTSMHHLPLLPPARIPFASYSP
jgi:1,4-dihydroxy-2-naphthoate octaprenyltransferase